MPWKRGFRAGLIFGGAGLVSALMLLFGIDEIVRLVVTDRLHDSFGDADVYVGSVLFSPTAMVISRIRIPETGIFIDTLIAYWNGSPFSPSLDSVLVNGGHMVLDESAEGPEGGGGNRRLPPARITNFRIDHGGGEFTRIWGSFSGNMPGDSAECILSGSWGCGVMDMHIGAENHSVEVPWFQLLRLPEDVAHIPPRLQGFDVQGSMEALWGDEITASGMISRVDGDEATMDFDFTSGRCGSSVRLTADLGDLRSVLVSKAVSLLGGMYVDFLPSGSVELTFGDCDTIGLTVHAVLDSLVVYSPGIDEDTVRTSAGLEFCGYACPDSGTVAIDSGRVVFGQVPVNFSLHGAFSQGARLEMRFWNGHVEGEALSSSIPDRLLGKLAGLRLGGSASFDIGLVLDWENPDSSDFTASVDVSRLTVQYSPVAVGQLRTGGSVLMRDSWGGMRLIHLDTLSNPDFIVFDSLHPSFEGILRCAEDATFRSHDGFCTYHIRNSIIADLKAGSFARGGSTITMQLARNLFLGREKTMSRKLQEVFLTWRLECYLSKDRMLEIYANIVELGPGVFGFDEAARYYFGKPFGDLTTREVAYLVSILPGPALYHRFFTRNSVPAYWEDYLDRLINISCSRGWIHGDSALAASADSIVFSP